MMLKQHHMPGCYCLNCGERIDGTSSIESKEAPSEGDITLCIYCGHIMAFADNLHLRELNDDEARMIAGDPRLLAMQDIRARIADMKMTKTMGVDELKVSVVGEEGRWELLLEVNGKEWKRFGPWTERKEAEVWASEALQRAEKVARKFWDTGQGQ